MIGLLGDVMLGRKVAERLASEGGEELWGPAVRAACADCDALVLNLECCVSERGSRTRLVPGKRFFFRAPPTAVEALAAVGATIAGVANNHALDFGPEALLETLDNLRGTGVTPAGAGPDEAAARKGNVVEAGGVRLGLLAVSDHPLEYAASPDAPGVSWADLRADLPGWLLEELCHLSAEADVVIAFPHWGPNMTAAPAAWQRSRARELLAAGADLVAGHSAHVFHGIERLGSRLALYDLGDALDDYAVDRVLRNDLGVLALWRPGGDPELELVGLSLDYCRTDVARGAEADWIATRLERACEELGTAVERLDESRFALRG
jgi:poly-gamma-glutamate capsule biosynthesis protein CapA/YwtB (metallophosphatase superfamily)